MMSALSERLRARTKAYLTNKPTDYITDLLAAADEIDRLEATIHEIFKDAKPADEVLSSAQRYSDAMAERDEVRALASSLADAIRKIHEAWDADGISLTLATAITDSRGTLSAFDAREVRK